MITLDSEISTIGGWSTIYRIKNDPNRCAKVLAPHRRKEGFPDPAVTALEKYGISDMLQYEFDNYQNIISKVPKEFISHFVSIYGLDTTTCGKKALIMELVMDERGDVAKNLKANTRPLSAHFFQTLERLRREVFLRHALDHFGIALRNILVRTPDCPVLIDFQNTRTRLKGQFWLALPFFVRQKVTRKFQRVYSDLGVPDFTKTKIIDDIHLGHK